MKINEVGYKWNGSLTKRAATTRIILHHAAAKTCTAQQIHSWHLANGWVGIGYHFFVRKDGSVYRGRPEDTVAPTPATTTTTASACASRATT